MVAGASNQPIGPVASSQPEAALTKIVAAGSLMANLPWQPPP